MKTIYSTIIQLIFLTYQNVAVGIVFDAKQDVIFDLISSSDPPQKINFCDADGKISVPTEFDAAVQTFIYIHGWMGHETTQFEYAENLRRHTHSNVIAVTWFKGSHDYAFWRVKARVDEVAKVLAEFLVNMVRTAHLSLDKTTLIGHSLGSHIAVVSAKLIIKNETIIGKIEIIIGLDPCGFLYNANDLMKLYRKDIETPYVAYILIIHTSRFGVKDKLGDADVYPDGGRIQTCCKNADTYNPLSAYSQCSHKAVQRLYWKLLDPANNFQAIQCDNFMELFNRTTCIRKKSPETYNQIQLHGSFMNNLDRYAGVFYTETIGNSFETIEPGDINSILQKIKWKYIETNKGPTIDIGVPH